MLNNADLGLWSKPDSLMVERWRKKPYKMESSLVKLVKVHCDIDHQHYHHNRHDNNNAFNADYGYLQRANFKQIFFALNKHSGNR
uniref:Uncharacterized protein n=1 Tax=Tetranychus urticae TaxID=32264 RepID=T1K624_TETUR